ncbi:Sas10/Utp3/C1D family protein [Ancylostoma caninum]|uniref:Sas10/Utp3/C1D family protein n=1 Tax=Ancylostoma caninum TaxID=29170 RepID=A0A368GY83_ANCCA|nr:Sas10/Utp3/C1D family protein [Ancylostoma caninum]
MGKKKNLASTHIDFEEQNEELQDDVDAYHAADRKMAAKAYKKKKAKEVEEVLNVEAEESDEDFPSESDFDDDSGDESYGVIGNEWGRKRKDFYGTEYVDEDWGGMREEELEDAELEEEDAAGRQAALDKAAALAVDLYEKEDETGQKAQSFTKETSLEWKFAVVKKLNKRTMEIIEEYNRRKDLMKVIVEPLAAVIQMLPSTSNVRKQLLLVHDVYTTYILNMMFFLKLKAESLAKKNPTDELIDSHPVMDKIERFSKMIKHVDTFLDKNATALKRLVKKASLGEPIESVVVEPLPEKSVQVKFFVFFAI